MDRAFTSSGNASIDPLASGSTQDFDTTNRVNRQAAWNSRTSPLRRSFGVSSTDGTSYSVDGDIDGMDGELDRNVSMPNLVAHESMGMTGIRPDHDERGRERDGARGPGLPRREDDGMLDDAMGGYRPSSRGLGRGSSVNMDSSLPTSYPGYIPTPPPPGPSQPNSTFMTATAPSSSRWYDNSDRHPPMPPLTLMNPLRRQSTDGYSQYAEPAGSLSIPPSHPNPMSPQSPQTSGFSATSGLFLPSNQYTMGKTNYSGPPVGASSYQSYQSTGRPQGDFYNNPASMDQFPPPRSAEPGPGPKSSSIRQNSGLSSSSRKTDGAGNRSKSHVMDGEDGTKRDENGIISLGPVGKDGWQLSVLQQPERARLCSFKEENETIDRRPVDPPPVVRLVRAGYTVEEMAVSSVRLRAIVVSATPTTRDQSTGIYDPYDYEERKLAQGADATTGETTQGLDQLQDLQGTMGVFAVFGKLSVRVPGVFRLRFELYETISGGERGLASCVSEPFEVYSPKQFKGMKESTALTRHFASQGFKIKLRQDSGAGRGGRKRKAVDGTNIADGSKRGNARPKTKPLEDGAGHDYDGLDGSRLQKMRADTGYGAASPQRPSSMHSSTMGRTDGFREEYMDGYMDDTADHAMDTSDITRSGSRADGKVSLPSIGKVLKQTSIWYGEIGAVADDDLIVEEDEDVRLVGGVAFQDGIRYGGDDGGLPPMSFGRLPSMISEGILPTTPGDYLGPSNPANYSLKGSLNLGPRFAAPLSNSSNTPPPPPPPPPDLRYDRNDGRLSPGVTGRNLLIPSFPHDHSSANPDDRQAFSTAVPYFSGGPNGRPFTLSMPLSNRKSERPSADGPPYIG